MFKSPQRVKDEPLWYEFVSESVLVGLSGTDGYTTRNTRHSADTEIFRCDIREPNKDIKYYHIKEYTDGFSFSSQFQQFHSLSCNKMNPNEFVVGTNFNGKIFDIRQMKKPRYTIVPDNGVRPRRFHVSWSPSGKYIFIHAPFSTREIHIDGWGPDENTNSLWDVSNERKVDLPLCAGIVPCVPMGKWRGVHTWIYDHLIVGTPTWMRAYSPHTKTMQQLCNDRIFSFSDDAYDDDAQRPYIGLAYNNKTLQLAAADEKNILIWSYFKLPPYKCTHIYPDIFPEVALPD